MTNSPHQSARSRRVPRKIQWSLSPEGRYIGGLGACLIAAGLIANVPLLAFWGQCIAGFVLLASGTALHTAGSVRSGRITTGIADDNFRVRGLSVTQYAVFRLFDSRVYGNSNFFRSRYGSHEWDVSR